MMSSVCGGKIFRFMMDTSEAKGQRAVGKPSGTQYLTIDVNNYSAAVFMNTTHNSILSWILAWGSAGRVGGSTATQ